MKKKISDAGMKQRKAAAQAHWAGRGKSMTVRVDPPAARALLTVPVKDRRRVATHGVMAAVDEYKKQA